MTFDISVNPTNGYVPAASVTINDAPSTVDVGATGTLTATVGPEQATDKTVAWESSNPDALAINAETGAYEAKAAGTATITARAGNQSATCDVTVSVQQQHYMLMAPAANQQQPVVEESEPEEVAEEPVSLTAADMLVNGNTTTVTFTVDSVSYSVTFTNNDGSYVINSQSVYEFGVVKSVSQVGNSIVITFGAPDDDTNVTQIVLSTDTSDYSIASYGEPSQELSISGLTSITVNGEIVP